MKKILQKPKVSIIIPVYNAEEFLRNCIDSVLDSEFEVILIDDGSTDKSAEIIKDYLKKYPDIIKAIFQENKGVSEARNAGIQSSTGTWIFFLDADDFLTKDGIKKIKKYMKSSVDIIAFSYQRVLTHETKTSIGSNKEKHNVDSRNLMIQALYGEGYDDFFSDYDFRSSWAKMFKRKLFNNHSFDKNIYIGEDFVTMLSIYSESRKCILVDSPIYCYYKNLNSTVNSFHKDYIRNFDIVNEKIENILSLSEISDSLEMNKAFNVYKMNELFLLMKYDYLHSKNKIVWRKKKEVIKNIIELYKFKDLYREIKREGNIKRIAKEKKIIYIMLFSGFYFFVNIIFRCKYR